MKSLILVVFSLVVVTQSSFAQLGSGNCLQFDGTNDYVNVPSSGVFDFGTGNFTISVWMKGTDPAPSPPERVILARYTQCGADRGFRISAAPAPAGNVVINVGLGGGLNGTINVLDDRWHFISVVRNGDNLTLYTDGIQEATRTGVGSKDASASSFPLDIGAFEPCGGGRVRFWNGEIDEVRVWNTVRTQAQIKDDMCTPLVGNESGLVAYWNMNEGTGNTVSDLTSNNNHGTRQ